MGGYLGRIPLPPEPLIAALFDSPGSATRYRAVDRKRFSHGSGIAVAPCRWSRRRLLGICYGDETERTWPWSEQGALWGSLAGLLAGASGLLVVPGVGAPLVAGPVINAIAGAVRAPA